MCFITLNGGRYGQEEKSQESSKEKEKEESSGKQRKEEIVEEVRKKGCEEKSEAENCKESRDETGSSDRGVSQHGVFGDGDARGGEDRPQPCGRMALSDGLQALRRVANRAALSPGCCTSG